MKEDNKVTRFCKATSASKEEALYFLEGFNWNLADAFSGFLRDQLPPIKKQDPPLSSQPPWRYRSRSPLRRRSSTTSVSESNKCKVHQDEITISNTAALGTSLDDGEKIVSISNRVQNYEVEGEGSSVIATKNCESTSIETDFPCSDPDSVSD